MARSPAGQTEKPPESAHGLDLVLDTAGWWRPDLEPLALRAVRATLRHLDLPGTCGVTILATDDSRIATLNAEFRGKPAATNVLSWPAEDLAAEAPGGAPLPPEPDFPGEPPFLGDIALAYETCAREAAAGEKPLEDHVTHLIVHGLLHLLGYDHIHDPDADLMERLEVAILGELGLPTPY